MTETVPCGIVFRSVGYRGVGLPGVPFDEGSGTIPNEGGRVEPGLYAAGWIKRGPSGVIGTNKKDATETIELLLDDARAGKLPPRGGGTLEELLAERGAEAVLYAGWEAIDAAERSAGEPHGRPRIKLATLGRASRRLPRQVTACYLASLARGTARSVPPTPTTEPWNRSPSSASAAATSARSRRGRGAMRKQAAVRAASTSAGRTRAT